MEDEAWAAIKSLNAQVVQLQGALAQAGTDLTLAKVQQVKVPVEEQSTLDYLQNQLWQIQTELNSVRKFQAFGDTTEESQITLLKSEMLKMLTDIVAMRAQGANAFNSQNSDARQVNASSGDQGNAADGDEEGGIHLSGSAREQELRREGEHLKVDIEYERGHNTELEERNQRLSAKISRLQREMADLSKTLKTSEQVGRHRKIDDTADLAREKYTPRFEHGNDYKGEMPPRVRQLVDSLRAESRTKDSALLYAHFEIRKEQKRREMAEEKGRVSFEKLQKLMILCDKQRKEIKLEQAKAVRRREQEKEHMIRRDHSQRSQLNRADNSHRSLPRSGSTQRHRPNSVPRQPSKTTPRTTPRVARSAQGTPQSAREG